MELAVCPECNYIIKNGMVVSDIIKKREYIGCAKCLKITPVQKLILLR